MALGVDVACHLGVASRAPLRFFRPATGGAFAATADVEAAEQLAATCRRVAAVVLRCTTTLEDPPA